MECETSFLVQQSLSVERGWRACNSDYHNDDDNDDHDDHGDHDDHNIDDHDDHDGGHDVGHYDDSDDPRHQNFESVIILKPT